MQLAKGHASSKLISRRAHVRSVRALNGRQVRAAAVAEKVDWAARNAALEDKPAIDILDEAFKRFGDDVAIAFSGAEDVALIEYASLTGRPFRVFSLDTGRLNPETYRLFDKVEKHYKIKIEYTFPDAKAVTDLVNAKGLFSFYEDGHTECCRVRKVQPLRRKLKTLKAWVTGQRKDQSPGTRQDVPVVQVDPVFEGLEGGPGSLVKFNPLSNATSAEVWNLLRTMNVPVNELHSKGYVSIGCEPCTKAVLPNQLEREGRWWWEDATQKECGLHSGNIKGAEGGAAQNGAKQQPAAAASAPSKPDAPSASSPTTTAQAAPQRSATAVLTPPLPAPSAAAPAVADAASAAVLDLWQSRTSAVEALSKEELQSLAAGQRDKSTLVVLYAPWCQYCKGMEADYEELAGRLSGSNVRVAKYQADVDREFSKTLGLVTFPTIILLLKGRDNYIKFTSTRRDPDTLGAWVHALAGSV